MVDSRLVPMSEEHLSMVLEWRNKPEVRANMYTSHEIDFEEHREWFKSVSNDKSKRYFIFEVDSKPCGVIGIVDIDFDGKKASWAFYSGDTSVRGIGTLMEVAAIDYVFNELKLEKLYCEVLSFNDSVIKFHRKHGFQIEGVFLKHHFAKGEFHDVYRLALFKKQWEKARSEITQRIKGDYSVGKTYLYQFSISKNDIITLMWQQKIKVVKIIDIIF